MKDNTFPEDKENSNNTNNKIIDILNVFVSIVLQEQ